MKKQDFHLLCIMGQVCSNQSCKNYKAVEQWNDLFSMHYSMIINWVRCQRHCQCLRHSIIHKLRDNFLGLWWPPGVSEVESEVINILKKYQRTSSSIIGGGALGSILVVGHTVHNHKKGMVFLGFPWFLVFLLVLFVCSHLSKLIRIVLGCLSTKWK